jgi:catechol 2,3-dioxygenase-like lactoylglutathione lyase family enzyme
MSNRVIARVRGVSLDAVKFHLANARDKLGITRAALRHWVGAPAGSPLHTREQEMTDAVAELALGPIGQIARGVSDVPRAEAWYRDVLGLRHLYTFGTLAFFDCGGTRLMIEERSGIEVQNLRNDSVLYFRVPDIRAAHEALVGRGVEFLGAPHMIHRHQDGTEEWMAFFKDCDGGLLALMAQVSQL